MGTRRTRRAASDAATRAGEAGKEHEVDDGTRTRARWSARRAEARAAELAEKAAAAAVAEARAEEEAAEARGDAVLLAAAWERAEAAEADGPVEALRFWVGAVWFAVEAREPEAVAVAVARLVASSDAATAATGEELAGLAAWTWRAARWRAEALDAQAAGFAEVLEEAAAWEPLAAAAVLVAVEALALVALLEPSLVLPA